MKLEFSRQIFQKYSNTVMKILPVGAALFLADRRADVTKLMVAFRSFANKPKKTDSKQNFDQYLCPIKIYQRTCGQTNTVITHCCLSTIHRKHLNLNCSQRKFDSQPRLQTPATRTDILAEV